MDRERGVEALLADLTEPQRAAVLHTEGPLLILAAAGSGKTRVITRRIVRLLSVGVRPWQVLALTFTNKAAGEMRERVERLLEEHRGAIGVGAGGAEKAARALTITTFHSLCARLLRRYAEAARLPGLKADYSIYDSADQSALVKKVITGLNLSTSNWPARTVLSVISNAKNDLLDAAAFAARASDFRGRQISAIYTAYERALHQANAVDFDDLLLLTARILKERSEIRAECQARWRYLLIDEYQDTNRAQFQIAAMLAGGGAFAAGGSGDRPNICVVGDPDQCLVPGTKIATGSKGVAIETVKRGGLVASAGGFGAVSQMPVDGVVSRKYDGPVVEVRTEGGERLQATPNHIAFARLRVASDLYYTYLMHRKGVGYRIGVTRGVRASKDGEIVSGLQVRTNQEVADAIWILRSSTDSAEARYYEHLYSIRYAIPTMVFFARGRTDMSQEWITRLHREVRGEDGAERLMDDMRIDRRFPHHRPGAVVRRGASILDQVERRHVMFTMFGDTRVMQNASWRYHRVQFVTSGETLREAARRLAPDLPIRDGVRGTWRIETSRKGYDDGVALAERIGGLDDSMEVISRARLTANKAFNFMPVSHLHAGMVVPVLRGGEVVEDVIASVSTRQYAGPVHDLSVPDTRNYVAGGIVVHNSIYGWRGADLSNIMDFEQAFPGAAVIKLGENFRSTAPILAVADGLIKHNKQRRDKPLFTARSGGDKVRVVLCRDEHHEASVILDHFRARHQGAEGDSGGDGVPAAFRAGRPRGAPVNAEPGPAVPWRSMAVFYRTNALSRVLEDAFRGAGIPYTIARGTAFFDREEIKNALAYLRVVANPADDVSLERIVNTPTRGLGNTSLAAIQVWASDQGEPLLEGLRGAGGIAGLTRAAQGAAGKFVEMLDGWTGAGSFLGATVPSSLSELVQRVIEESGLEGHYKKQAAKSGSEQDAERLDNLGELISSAAEFEREFAPERDPGSDVPVEVGGENGRDEGDGGDGDATAPSADAQSLVGTSPARGGGGARAEGEEGDPFGDFAPPPMPPLLQLLRAYLESVALVADADAVDPAQGAVTLMTLHAAKGLEFDTVAIVGLEEGLMPHSRAAESEADLEEERRLCFVGITRAMRSLTMCSARYRTNRGVAERTIASRFIEEFDPAHTSMTNLADDADISQDADWDADEPDQAERVRAGRRAAETAVKSQFPPGCTVRHPQFGVGEVVSVESGATPRATVRFRQVGTKTLILEYARLTRVG